MRSLNYIGGAWQQSYSGETIGAIDPATEDVFAIVPASGEKDVHAAVAAARTAFDGAWKHTSGQCRGDILQAVAEGIRENADSLALLEVHDSGKPIVEARYDVSDAAACFEYYAGLAKQADLLGRQIPVPDERFNVRVRYEPAGVIGAIVPWNFPLVTAAWKIAPALAAGCSIVVKPSEFTPLTALELARIAGANGVPPGVINVVTGFGYTAGAALAAHPGLAKLSFTGSVPVGQAVMAASAEHIRDVALELGGKSALIAFDDVDVDHAVEWIMMGAFYNQGQICSATTRVLIQARVYDAVIERLVAAAAALRLGPGANEETQMGPLISKAQRLRVSGMVEQGRRQGANILVGGARPAAFDRGYYFSPTIATEVPRDNILWTEEVFGPVVCVSRFDTEEEAVREANSSRFGLASAVLSADKERCERVALQMEAGIVWVNCSQPAFPQAPWGGVKHSGFKRGLGEWGLHEFLEPKQITDYRGIPAWGHYSF